MYVDDNTIVTKPVAPGARFRNDRVEIVEEEVENDRSIPGDLRTSRILNDVGNSICPFISVTVDFFKKPSSSRMTIMASSALPPNVKRATMTNEVLRRLRNTKRSLPWSVFADTISEFSNDMKHMGYSESFRAKVIQAAITRRHGSPASASPPGI